MSITVKIRWWLGPLVAGALPLWAQQSAEAIRLNQVGFYPAAPKVAVVVGASANKFYLTTPDRATTVFTGVLGAAHYDSLARQST
ncbi:MAG: hypothetical protein EOO39_25270, partial [Cytophagaceae bacterium]